MKRIAFIYILLSALCFGCGEKNMSNDDTPQCGCEEENMNSDPLLSLEGTRWKLAGIVDTKTCVLQVLEPKDCEECYTLTFVTNEKAEGWGYTSPIVIEFSMLGKYSIEEILLPLDEDKFINSLFSRNTTLYSVTANELRFINQIEKYYLSFKRQ